MKKVGIVGGLGPASTIDYYRDIIDNYRKIKGDDIYPEIVIDSVKMKEVIENVLKENYDGVAEIILKSVENLKNAGADFVAIASNTPHIAWREIKMGATIPIISIIEETCNYIIKNGYKRILVFATSYTMKNGLYSNALENRGIEAILPNENDIEELGNIIYPNLENGIVLEEDKRRMIEIAEKYIKENNVDALLLGCTEIPLMIKAGDVSIPIINTTQIHVEAIGREIFKGEEK